MRLTIALVLALTWVLLAFLQGEGGLWPSEAPVALACVAASILVGLVAPGRLGARVVLVVAMLSLSAAAYWVSLQVRIGAFNACIDTGGDVRRLLGAYQQKNRQFPERLDQLDGAVPCGLLSGRSLLVYEKTKTGYVLSFGDWLVTHRATESEPFSANK